MIAATQNQRVVDLLKTHPEFVGTQRVTDQKGLWFGSQQLDRSVEVGKPEMVEYGLIELIDNNPLVCTNRFSIPDLVTSVGLVCLGPLVLAGIVLEEPILVCNAGFDEQELDLAFRRLGWTHGVLLRTEEFGSRDVIMASGSAVIETPEDPEDLADLYEERFGSSLLVKGNWESAWDPDLVRGKAICSYRISVGQDTDSSLVTVRVLCDGTGAFQAAQLVNAMNVMCGYPDSLGLSL